MPESTGSNADAQAAFGEPASERPRKRAGVLGYVVAALLVPAAIGGAIAWFVAGFGNLDDRINELQRVPVPGRGVVTLGEGKQSIYFETPDGENVGVPALTVLVRREGEDSPLQLRSSRGTTYSVGDHDGQSILGFTTPSAGRYAVSVRTNDPLPTSPVLAIGEGVGHHIVGLVVGGLGIFFGGALAAGALILITWRRRRR